MPQSLSSFQDGWARRQTQILAEIHQHPEVRIHWPCSDIQAAQFCVGCLRMMQNKLFVSFPIEDPGPVLCAHVQKKSYEEIMLSRCACKLQWVHSVTQMQGWFLNHDNTLWHVFFLEYCVFQLSSFFVIHLFVNSTFPFFIGEQWRHFIWAMSYD